MRATIVPWIFVVGGMAGCLSDIGSTGDTPPPLADPQLGCSLGCHGTDDSNAPPKGISGSSATTDVGVGAHREHLVASPTWHRQLVCADCHVVPAEVGSLGHIDGDNKAEVTFSMAAGGNGSTWTGTTCTTHCHGSQAIGGSDPTPTWTNVGAGRACGTCHSTPPPAPHPADPNCSSCHSTLEPDNFTFRDPESHINGQVDFVNGAAGDCTSCHGSPTSSAPPRDLAGNTASTARGVGAHVAHLAQANWHRQVVCTDCHVVPKTQDAPGHIDGDNLAEVKFGTLNPAGAYTAGNATCSTNYCHGNGRANTGTIVWTSAGPLACGACHSINGTGMSGDHRRHIVGENMRCSQCHMDVVDANMTIKKADLHVNGVHEVKMANGTFDAQTRRCSNTGCHGTETW